MSLKDQSEARLRALAGAGLLRAPAAVSLNGRLVETNDGWKVNFSSNDYLGLGDAELAVGSVSGAGASRMITGTRSRHREAERAVASFMGFEDGRLFASGYAASVSAIPALVGPEDVVFSDALNHASLIDGIRLSRAQVHVYPHRDVEALAALLERHRASGRNGLIVSDAMFSMDGTIAPLDALSELSRQHATALYVDEAHSAGVLGNHGRGAADMFHVKPDISLVTFGKAFGLFGACICTDEHTAAWFENRGRGYVFSTALPEAHAEWVIDRLNRIRAGEKARARLLENTTRLREGLAEVLDVRPPGASCSPIVPVVIGDVERVMKWQEALLEAGYLGQAIRSPTVSAGSERIRLVATALHTDEDIEGLIEAIRKTEARVGRR